jgi:hypothetical protein
MDTPSFVAKEVARVSVSRAPPLPGIQPETTDAETSAREQIPALGLERIDDGGPALRPLQDRHAQITLTLEPRDQQRSVVLLLALPMSPVTARSRLRPRCRARAASRSRRRIGREDETPSGASRKVPRGLGLSISERDPGATVGHRPTRPCSPDQPRPEPTAPLKSPPTQNRTEPGPSMLPAGSSQPHNSSSVYHGTLPSVSPSVSPSTSTQPCLAMMGSSLQS